MACGLAASCARGWCDADCQTHTELHIYGTFASGNYDVSFGGDELAPTCTVTVDEEGRSEAEAGCPFAAWGDEQQLVLTTDGQSLDEVSVVLWGPEGQVLLDEVVPLDVEWMEVCDRRCRQAEGELLHVPPTSELR